MGGEEREPSIISDAPESEPESEPGSTSETSSSSPLLCREGTSARDVRAGRSGSGRGTSGAGDEKLSLTCAAAASFSRTNRFAFQNVTGCSADLDRGLTEFRAAAGIWTQESPYQLSAMSAGREKRGAPRYFAPPKSAPAAPRFVLLLRRRHNNAAAARRTKATTPTTMPAMAPALSRWEDVRIADDGRSDGVGSDEFGGDGMEVDEVVESEDRTGLQP